jgi:acyl-coenzyme A thioesterase PaaI-like protein
VQLNTTFLRAVPGQGGRVLLQARVLRQGRSLVFGEVHLFGPDEQLAAHVTTTCSLM